jgi:hypothetical protein
MRFADVWATVFDDLPPDIRLTTDISALGRYIPIARPVRAFAVACGAERIE